jgi:hypothetical protein
MPLHDLSGHRFGILSIVSRAENSADGAVRWNCLCDCGNTSIVRSSSLRRGVTRSCGCLNFKEGRKLRPLVDRTKISQKRNSPSIRLKREYASWSSMRSRCLNANDPKYRLYGARGISICERWSSFESFLADMGKRPEGMTLDRIDPNKNYEPQNCSWASIEEQSDNRRCTRYVSPGVSLRQFADQHGLTITQLKWHFNAGHDLTKCVKAIKNKRGKHAKCR